MTIDNTVANFFGPPGIQSLYARHVRRRGLPAGVPANRFASWRKLRQLIPTVHMHPKRA